METVSLPEKMTLPVILDLFSQMDEGLIFLEPEDMTTLGEKAREKIDSYKALLDRCDVEIEYFTRMADPFLEKKAQLNATKIRVEKMLKYFMEKSGTEVLSGDIWSLKLKKLPENRIESVTNTEPTSALYLKYPDLIGRKYGWKLAEIKKKLKSKTADLELAKMFKLADTVKTIFTPKSEVKK